MVMCCLSHQLFGLVFLITCVKADSSSFQPNNVVFAVNAGGEKHIDSYGVLFRKDFLKEGVPSDYGKSLKVIKRAPKNDYYLYQVERYSATSFMYPIFIKEDGEYVLVLKFCEVYFSSPGMKVFKVSINGLLVLDNMDIYARVGKGVAHDEYFQLTILNGILYWNNKSVTISNNSVEIMFHKGWKDNPKINAIMLYKGNIEEIPKLPTTQDSTDRNSQSNIDAPVYEEDPYGRLLVGFTYSVICVGVVFLFRI